MPDARYDSKCFELPLMRHEFRRALHAGLGRAWMHVDAHGADDVRDDIRDALLVCRVYDPQVEGFAAEWLADFCARAGLVDDVFAACPSQHWDKAARCALLKALALRGHGEARERLYAAAIHDGQGTLQGASELIELDGERGLVHAVRVLGVAAAADPSLWLDGIEMREFDHHVDREGHAATVLEARAGGDPSIAAYLDRVASSAPGGAAAVEPPAMEALLAAIAGTGRVARGASYWIRTLPDTDLDPVVRLALTATEESVVVSALRSLVGARALRFRLELVALVEHEADLVRHLAATILGRHEHSSLRDAGLAALGRDPCVGLRLLRLNAVGSDVAAVLDLLVPEDDPDRQHDLVFPLVEMLEATPRAWHTGAALYAYDRSPCRTCRLRAVRLLIDKGTCPEWVRDEGRFDESERVRTLCG